MPKIDFKGKQFISSHHYVLPFRELVVDKKKSFPKNKETKIEDNLIIEGDNLHGLKALLPNYSGRIKCIYIDPPYNTGNEGWCYNDNVNSPLIREWLKNSANPVDREDLERHDKWLCMMYPRIKLLHELLSDDGAIFISIDDNEIANLRLLMDEIFGEYNFVSQITVQLNPRGRTLDKFLAKTHEYVLTYVKDINNSSLFEVEKNETQQSDYKYEDKKGKYRPLELRNRNPVFNRKNRPNLFFPIYVNKKNNQISLKKNKEFNIPILPLNSKGEEGCWTWGQEKVLKNSSLLFAKYASTGNWRVFRKDYLYKNSSLATTKEKALWTDKSINNENGKELLSEIFGHMPFDYPKSIDLIKKCLRISTRNQSNDIILDSFAGSGTTAHAVMDLNHEDNGNRKYILVEMEDYANNLTAERVRLINKGVPSAKNKILKKGYNKSFSYFKLGKEFNIDSILRGNNLPSYESLSRYVFYTATGVSLEKSVKNQQKYFIGKTNFYEIFLIYKPDITFLRSNDSALSYEKAEIIKNSSKLKKLVFATSKFMSQKQLDEFNIIFCQLPYAIHKVFVK